MNTKPRCRWCQNDPLLADYHDNEWGIPTDNDDELFERMSLQIFQAGLNWKLILQKRGNFSEAFSGFKISEVVKFDENSYNKLLNNTSIIRNRQKIKSVLLNAKVIQNIQSENGSFKKFLDNLPSDLPTIQREFRTRFKFMGPEITRMFIYNIGKIPPPHEKQCWRFDK